MALLPFIHQVAIRAFIRPWRREARSAWPCAILTSMHWFQRDRLVTLAKEKQGYLSETSAQHQLRTVRARDSCMTGEAARRSIIAPRPLISMTSFAKEHLLNGRERNRLEFEDSCVILFVGQRLQRRFHGNAATSIKERTLTVLSKT